MQINITIMQKDDLIQVTEKAIELVNLLGIDVNLITSKKSILVTDKSTHVEIHNALKNETTKRNSESRTNLSK